jgi:hypothetical protein
MLITPAYSRALAEGALIDVSDIASNLRLPWFVAMSVALWNHTAVKGNEDNLIFLIKCADIRESDQFQTDSNGTLRYAVYFGGPWVAVRIYVLRAEAKDVAALILLRDEEELYLRCPRTVATSFFTM